MDSADSKGGTTSIAAIMTSLSPPGQGLESGNLGLGVDNQDLLGDPNLVENYSDILRKKPNRMSSGGVGNGSETDNESESASGSVVVTKNSANSSPLKQRTSLLSNTSSHYSMQMGNEPLEEEELEEDDKVVDKTQDGPVEELGSGSKNESDDQTSVGTTSYDVDRSPTGDMTHEYEYSDSDFEESMEQRLHDMNASASPELKQEDLSGDELEHPVLRLQLSEDDGSVSDGELQRETQGLVLESDEDSEADSDSDDYQPLSPPKELDPEKLYALYAFNGPDPSHCQLRQDESCTLLNDQDSYWWLVKRSQDSKIGFAPAEILETFPERLARLNCWKNENMSSSSNGSPKGSENKINDEEVNAKIEKSSSLQGYMKDNKSVSFNDVVSYADRFIEANDDTEDEEDATHYDQFSEAKLKLTKFPDDEEMSEVVSDVSFNTAAMTPLNIEKVRRPKVDAVVESAPTSAQETIKEEPTVAKELDESEKEESDDLHKIFEAPIVPFSKNQSGNGQKLQPSNSDYSISTIGDFSPSSSEWTNESPQLRDGQFNAATDTAAIPPSRAIQDFSKYVEEEQSDGEATSICRSVESNADQDKKPNDKESLQEQENKHSSVVSTSSSSEQIFLDSGRINSFTSINSATSISRQHSNAKGCSNKLHPLIDRLYNPVFDKMDELMAQLDEIANK